MGEEEQIILPDEFERVEWIENPISSNTSTNGKIILPLDFKFYKDGSGDSSLVFETEHAFSTLLHDQCEGVTNGFTTQNNNQEFFWLLWNGYVGIHAGEYISFTDLKPQRDKFLKIKIEWTPSLITFTVGYNGQTYTNSKTPNSTWSCKEIGLFHKLLGQQAQVAYKGLNGKKKYCKIWKNGELVYDLVPCIEKENNEACMYDLVSQQVFHNQGTGKFLTNKDYEWNYPLINNDYNLPAGFKKCVYLQSDGTQWIDTDVVPNNETGLYFKALQLSYGDFVPFGVEENGNTIYPPRFNSKDLYYKWGGTSIKMMTWDKADDLIFHSSLNLYNSKIAKFDSEGTDVVSFITSQEGTYTLPIWLFTFNVNGSYNSTYGKWVGRIYRAQITQGDALIHDYVPCLDANNRPCMYDLIEQETLYNQSGGTEFAYCVEHQLPSDFVKLKYLESNNNLQYIKTGYIPTNNTGMYVDAYNTVVEDTVVMGMQNTTGNDRMWIGGVMKATYGARYGWGTMVTPGGTGDVRFEASLNWLNDKKSIITCPAFVQKVNTLSDLTFTPNQDIYIFGWNRQGSLFHWKGRIYRAKISEGSEIVRDYVPAYDQKKFKPCMYDLINNVAYYNDGEGEFKYDNRVEGSYTGYSGLGCIGNRLGGYYPQT